MTLELTVVPRHRPRRARRRLRQAVVGLVAVLALALLVPAMFGLSYHTVTDDAMSGTMQRGTAVLAQRMPSSELKVGDVITYTRTSAYGDELVTRRIAAIDDGVIWTRSDSTGALDPWTPSLEHPIQARAVVGVPYAGYVLDTLSEGAELLRKPFSWLD